MRRKGVRLLVCVLCCLPLGSLLAAEDSAVPEAMQKIGAERVAKGAKASWSPDGDQIVYSVMPFGAGLELRDLQTGKSQRLVDLGKDPAFCPTGAGLVAYVRGTGRDEEVWVVDAQGENDRKIASGGFPCWSGDGQTLYFQSRQDWKIRAADMSDHAQRDVKITDVYTVSESWYPAVSPDGKWVAYATPGQIVLVDLASGKKTRHDLSGRGGLVGWSPDSRQVGYGGYGYGAQAGLWVLDVQGDQLKRIAEGDYTMPAWSPDGTKIAFDLRGKPSVHEVWMIDAKSLENIDPDQAKPDRYALPADDASPEELLEFIRELKAFRPRNASDYREHRLKAPAALTAAAKRIMEQEKDESSEAHAAAALIMLEQQVQKLSRLRDDERKEVLEQIRTYLTQKAGSQLTPDDLSLAQTAARNLEYGGEPELAADTYEMLASVLRKQGDESREASVRLMEGAARRLRLVGQPLKMEGVTVEGEAFDWSEYRGKVVLVDFWATWCGPCLAEMPNVRKNYERYHERGFDVVGISLDRERKAIEQFLEKQPLPWVTLHHPDGGRHPMAEYYGINAIPTVLLVDREGKVVSLRARGNALDRLLAVLIGPAEEPSSSEEEATAK